MKKRMIAWMSLLIAVFGLAACTQKPAKTDNQKKPVQLRIVGNYGMLNGPDYDFNTDPVVCWLEKQTGYDLEVMRSPLGAGTSQPQAVKSILEKDMQPDIFLNMGMGEKEVSQLGQEGVFLDLREYFQDKTGASKVFWDRLAENMTPQQQENVIRKLIEPETGAIYSIPTVHIEEPSITDYQVWINAQWMQELGLDSPTTLEELYNVLKVFQTNYPGYVPLYGAVRRSYNSADLVNWLICNFMYFDDRNPFCVTVDGTLFPGFTQEEYRQALQFIRKLKDEGLLVLEEKQSYMQKLDLQPVGMAVGWLMVNATRESENIYAYDALPPLKGQACVYNNAVVYCHNYINAQTEHPEEAFRLMMTMWSEEASYWLRYGEYGVDWTDAEPGSISVCGYPLKIKVLKDYAYDYASGAARKWSIAVCSLFRDTEGVYTQYLSYTDVEAYIIQRTAAAWELYDAAAQANNPEKVCPVLRYTEESLQLRTAIDEYFKTATEEFIFGIRDPYSDEDWDAYLADLENLGLTQYTQLAQKAYDQGM